MEVEEEQGVRAGRWPACRAALRAACRPAGRGQRGRSWSALGRGAGRGKTATFLGFKRKLGGPRSTWRGAGSRQNPDERGLPPREEEVPEIASEVGRSLPSPPRGGPSRDRCRRRGSEREWCGAPRRRSVGGVVFSGIVHREGRSEGTWDPESAYYRPPCQLISRRGRSLIHHALSVRGFDEAKDNRTGKRGFWRRRRVKRIRPHTIASAFIPGERLNIGHRAERAAAADAAYRCGR